METLFLGTDQESPSFFIPISPDIFFVLPQPTCRNIYYYQTSNSLGTSCLMGTGSPTYFPQPLSAFSSHPLCHTLTYRMTLHHIIHSQHTFLRNRESNKNQGMEHLFNKDISIPRTTSNIVLQIYRYQHKNTNMNSQNIILSPELRKSATVGPQKCSITEAQEKDLKIALMNMFKDLKRGYQYLH